MKKKNGKDNWMTFRTTEEYRIRVKVCAALEGMTIQEVMEEALDEWIEKRQTHLEQKVQTKVGIGRIQKALKNSG